LTISKWSTNKATETRKCSGFSHRGITTLFSNENWLVYFKQCA